MSDCAYEMKMPAKYVDLSADEMEYDGGFLNFIVGIVSTAVGITLSVAAAATGSKELETASHIATVAGVILTAGTGMLVGGVATGLVKTLTTQATMTTFKTIAGEELTEAAAKAGAQVVCGDSLSTIVGIGSW